MYSLLQQGLIITEHTLLYAPLILGAYFVIGLMKIPNLSIESAMLIGALAGSFATTAMPGGPLASLVIGLAAAFVAGSTVGLAAGLLNAYGRLSHLLCSIVIVGFAHGASLLVLGGSHKSLTNHAALNMLSFIPAHPTLPILLLTGVGAILCMAYLLKTRLGITCAFYGDNAQFLASHKISTTYSVCAGLAIANALAGISGFLVAQNNGFIDTSMAHGIPLLCITALMLGKTVNPTKATISAVQPLIGIACYFVVQSCLLHIGIDLHYFQLVQAVVLTCLFLMQKSPITLGI